MKTGLARLAQRQLGARAELAVVAGLLAAIVFAVASGLLAWETGLPLAIGAGVAGYLPRRRIADAAVLGLPLLLAQGIEWGVGPFVLAVLVLPVHGLTRRPRFALCVGTGLLGLLLLAIAFKTRFAGTRLTWQDVRFFILQFHDNVGVMASQPTLVLYAGGVIAALAAWCSLGWFLDRAALPSAPVRQGAAAMLSVTLIAGSVLGLARDVERVQAMPAWDLGIAVNARADPLLPFLATMGLGPHWTVRAVDTGPLRRNVGRLTQSGASGARPADIVVFLQESQFNPRSIAGCSGALCQVAGLEPAPATRVQGPLRVHVFGGGTWLTEFAFATGVPHDTFGPAGDFAPFNVAPGTRASFIRSLRAAGYRTVALYPVRGGMMNARAAYAGYGFDRFLDSDDLGLSGSFNTPDEALHRAALRVLQDERGSGKPVFLMVVTIFNHGEHGVRMDRVPAKLQEAAAADFADPAEARNVADYVWRTQQFVQTMRRTRQALLDSRQPTVMAWFGDHQPAFATATGLRSKIVPLEPAPARVPPKYQTWFEVDSNLPTASSRRNGQPLDIVFLPGLIAQLAGVPLDGWLAANVATREQCDGLLAECADPQAGAAYLTYLGQEQHAFALD